jgi:uncharacterized protein
VPKPLALITGASAGIGATFARTLAARGYDLVLVARRRERLDALAAELSCRSEVLPADLTDAAQLRLIESRVKAAPAIDLLINNAGFGIPGVFWETDAEAQNRMHQLHVIATMRLTHAALAAMLPRGGGAIVNVSSVAGFIASPSSVTYSATKCWMNRFTEGVYMELGRAASPVRIQALCPGFTRTEFQEVAGIHHVNIPESLWTDPQKVVDDSLAGLERNRLFVVPGWRYRALVSVLPLIPAWAIRRASIRIGLRHRS